MRKIAVSVTRRTQVRQYEPYEVSLSYETTLEEDQNYKKELRRYESILAELVDEMLEKEVSRLRGEEE